MRFAICVIEPEGYRYSHFLYDICKYINFGIESSGYDCCILRNKLAKDRINIIMGAHNQTDPSVVNRIQQAGRYILLQSEIITGDSINRWAVKKSFADVYLPLMQGALVVWDGVESNIDQLKRHGISAELLRLGYHERMEEIIHKKNKDIDFLFCGSLTLHRKKLLDALTERGLHVVTMFDDAAMYRNDLIARTRVNLAPNQGPGMNHLGGGRVLYLVNNRSVVVVERCMDQGRYEHCFPWAETDRWADLCLETLHRPDLGQITEEYYERFKKIRMVDFMEPLIEICLSKYKSDAPSKTYISSRTDMPESVSSIQEVLASRFQHATAEQDLISIIILPHNRLDQTKKCLKSISKHTPEPHEFIFVDNRSAGETSKWLKRRVRENSSWRLVEHKEEPGFAKAANQGMVACRGEYILILDSPVVVSPGWLSGMLECLNRATDVGIVGPMTNHIAGPQKVVSDEYRALDYLDKYAEKFRERYRHRRILQRTIAGFCVLFKRTLAEKIGLFDESFGSGDLGAEDFCLRAVLEGYRNYIAGDVFVHRFEDRNSIGNQPDDGSIKSGNRKILEKKWVLSTQNPLGKKLAVLRATEVATDLYQKGLIDKAVEALIDCIKISPDAKEIYYELAQIFLESKRFAEAFEVVETMPDSAKEELKGLECAGFSKEGLKSDDEADRYADRMLSLDQKYPPALNLKGVLAYKKGDIVRAEDYFKKALGSDAGYGEACTNLGVLRWAAGNEDEALAYLSKGFVLSPTVPDHSTLYYSAVSSCGIYSEAQAFFQDAKGLYPHNKNIAFLYIDTLIRQGDFSSAMSEIEDAIIEFGLDEGFLNAALSVRERIGPRSLYQNGSIKATLSLSMIVKNEEQHLAKCLRSVRAVVDEMIVVDTGSTDKTMDIAKVFGAQVFEFPWTGDFSEARNHSLSKAKGDWILILDGDEVLSPLDLKTLRELTGKKPASPVAYSILTRNYTNNVSTVGWTPNNGEYPEEAGRGWLPSPKVRLFTRSKEAFFSDPVHETLEASLRKAEIPVHLCNIVVHHYGKLEGERDLRKGEDYYVLGKIKYENDPTNATYIHELARQAQTLGKYEESIELFLKLLELAEVNAETKAYLKLNHPLRMNPETEVYILLTSSYLVLDRYDEALSASRKAVELSPALKEVVQTYAICEIVAGSPDKAYNALHGLLMTMPDYPPAILLLAVFFCIQGQVEKVRDLFRLLSNKGFNLTPSLNTIAKQLHTNKRNRESISILKAAIENRMSNQGTIDLLETVEKTI